MRSTPLAMMSAAAVLGMTAIEALGARCCALQSVSEDSKAMKKLLFVTGMPTMRMMAVKIMASAEEAA